MNFIASDDDIIDSFQPKALDLKGVKVESYVYVIRKKMRPYVDSPKELNLIKVGASFMKPFSSSTLGKLSFFSPLSFAISIRVLSLRNKVWYSWTSGYIFFRITTTDFCVFGFSISFTRLNMFLTEDSSIGCPNISVSLL